MRSLLLFVLAVITPAVMPGETLKGAVKDSSGTPIGGALLFIHWDAAGITVGLKDNIGIKSDLTIRTEKDGTFTVDLPPVFMTFSPHRPRSLPIAARLV
jgi:hypothetical protein